MPWSGLALITGTDAATVILMQIERLAIPIVLDLEALALFAILAVFGVAPFRPVEVSVYRTLLTRVGRAPKEERLALVRRELARTALLVAVVSALVATLTPHVFAFLFADKYEISFLLLLGAIVAGQLRVLRGLIAAVISACAAPRELAVWNLYLWLIVGTTLLGGWSGARWGLTGFVWGVNAGAALNALLTLPLMLRHLQRDGSRGAET